MVRLAMTCQGRGGSIDRLCIVTVEEFMKAMSFLLLVKLNFIIYCSVVGNDNDFCGD